MVAPKEPRKAMAAIEEVGPKVEERPATHHKNAQTYVLGLTMFLILVFAFSAYSRMTNTDHTLFAEEEVRQPRLQSLSKQSSASFQDEVDKAKRLLLESLPTTGRKQATAAASGPPPPAHVQAVKWPAAYTPPAVKDDRMKDLIFAARMEPLAMNLGFEDQTNQPQAAVPVPSTRPHDKPSIDAEIARVTQLQQTLRNGGTLSPDALAGVPGLPTRTRVPTAATSFFAGAPSAVPSRPAAARAPSSVIGQPQSSQTRLPGQRLLPLTTVIRASLDQTVMSDYVGPLRLLVVDDVYDVKRHHVLIPKGSKVLAASLRIGNVNAPIHRRMGITVRTMVLPDGKTIDFSRQAALDREGIAAVAGSTDYHLIEQFLGVAAFAVLSAGTSRQGSGIANDNQFQGELGASARQQLNPIIARYLSLVPTITLEPGTPLRIFLQEEMWVTPWKAVGHRFVAGTS